MNILHIDAEGKATIDLSAYENVYDFSFLKGKYRHEELAEALAADIKDGSIEAQMIIIESERLEDDHWDDPNFMHKTNHICICEAQQEARRELVNRYFRDEDLEKFLKENELSTWRHNWRGEEEGERRFKFEVEDAVFEYQERIKMVEAVVDNLDMARKFLLDEGGYVFTKEEMIDSGKSIDGVEFDDEDYALVTDEETIEKQKNAMLHRMLKPQMRTEHNRVYDMPSPFCYWDYRSFWHQWYVLIDHRTNQILIHRGNTGSSGAREENGKWAHTFCQLAKHHSIEVPTWHLIYDEHNQLRLHKSYDEFKTLHYDLTGNYHVDDYRATDKLFEGRKVESETSKSRGWFTEEKEEEAIEQEEDCGEC